jgi:hypothetical protein
MEDDDQPETRKSRAPIQVPVPPIPDLAGKRGGNPRFPIRPGPGIAVPGPAAGIAGAGSRGRHRGAGRGINFLVCSRFCHKVEVLCKDSTRL